MAIVEQTSDLDSVRGVGERSRFGALTLALLLFSLVLFLPGRSQAQATSASPAQVRPGQRPPSELETTEDWNRRLGELLRAAEPSTGTVPQEYRIGPEDLIELTVFEAPELNRSLRVSAGGEVSLPLLGAVKAAGLTPRELEFVLQELFRRTYLKDPHIGVFVKEMQSHPVAVFGAVKKPGVFQIRGVKTLLEVLAQAEGLAEDAGDTVIVLRGAGLRGIPSQSQQGEATESTSKSVLAPETLPAETKEPTPNGALEIGLKELLESGDLTMNVPVYPGDIIKVTRAGIVYVVGEVRKPGGFVLKSNENISVLQAIALAEGLGRTAAKGQARIIRTEEKTGRRVEVAINLDKILSGKASDPLLRPKDIVFVPNSAARGAFHRALEVTLQTVSGILVFRR